MAKRFTDSEKWKRPWFAELPNIAKLAWIYICDDCDHCGVWVANFKRLSFDLASRISAPHFEEWFGNKVVLIEEDKYFIPSFIEFQYGDKLSEKNNAHRGIFKFLEKYQSQIEGAKQGLTSPMAGALVKVKVKVTDKVKVKEEAPLFDFESLWEKYPLKKEKQDALKRFRQVIKTESDYADISRAIDRYIAQLVKDGTDPKYIKHMATFIEKREAKPFTQPWRDYLDPQHGSVTLPKPESHSERLARLRIENEASKLGMTSGARHG